MAKREPVVLNGQPIGRIKAGWLLFKESWGYLQADKEMVWIPLITALINLFLFGILMAVFFFVAVSGYLPASEEGDSVSAIELAFVFVAYVVGAFTLALSQAAIANTVYVRAHGGDATLGDSLKKAFSHWSSLLLWSVITSTVGLLLRAIAERSKLLGKIVALLLGSAWSIMTYFVVPAMIIDQKSAFASIKKSTQVFKDTWGETVVSNISIGVVFFIVHILAILSFFGLLVLVVSVGSPLLGIIIIAVGYIFFLIAICLLQSAMAGVVKTLLYIYAAEGTVPPNFNPELLEKMLAGKKTAPLAQTAPAGQVPPVQTSAQPETAPDQDSAASTSSSQAENTKVGY